jgi:hypothetical protein
VEFEFSPVDYAAGVGGSEKQFELIDGSLAVRGSAWMSGFAKVFIDSDFNFCHDYLAFVGATPTNGRSAFHSARAPSLVDAKSAGASR